MSAAEEHDAHDIPLPAETHEPLEQESLTDVIDRLDRKAFRRALDRRHGKPLPSNVIEESLAARRTRSS